MKGKGNLIPLSSSVPTNLDHLSQNGQIIRANSELGHYYLDMGDNRSTTSAPRPRVASYNPAATDSKSSLSTTKDPPLDNGVMSTTSAKGKVIYRPSNGMPIPPGYSFGAKDSAAGESNNDRDRKVKSGIFTRLTKGVAWASRFIAVSVRFAGCLRWCPSRRTGHITNSESSRGRFPLHSISRDETCRTGGYIST